MLRILIQSDISELVKLEQTVHVVPWTKETFQLCFNNRYIGWAVEEQSKIIGFLIASIKERECHILNLCVAHPYQNQGWGARLLNHALHHAARLKLDMIYLEVRRTNTKAIALYEKMKFHLIGERKNYYPTVSGKEDALIFARLLHDYSI